MKYFIGIDPGKAGGIAVVGIRSNDVLLLPIVMPRTERDILEAIQKMQRTHPTAQWFAMLERARSSPRMGVVSAFTFGVGYGGLRMALTACSIPFDEVSPVKWQRALGCLSGGDKNVTKKRAQELFPGLLITHAIADALLLAEYCRRCKSLVSTW